MGDPRLLPRLRGGRASCGGPALGSVGAGVLLEETRWFGVDGCFAGISRLVLFDGIWRRSWASSGRRVSAPIWWFRGRGGGCVVLPEADLVALVRGSELISRDSEEGRRDLREALVTRRW